MTDILSFWLIPTHETRSWFVQDIERLAKRFGAPVFEPHLTVHSGPIDVVASPASVLAESAFELEPIVLQPIGLRHSSTFTKTLFIEFHQTQALLDLQSKLRERVPSDYLLQPHLSLLYHHAPEDELEHLAKSTQIPTEPVRFEVIQAVRCPAVNETADDVRSWEILEEWRL